ncbi:hypothetical protein EVJ20_13315 [Exiguobacterium sp. SH0S1]|uniref:hypothetical protein n=1 Tax=Exiguobacterium sp. SH0S1 TaxID=2510949 RepID=UPI00103BE318|nr:hypothetical protein [Exiguobacterium sp. SH0S1]TCI75664.1 hypothetical protein EVJ20_13315 [Exiguobacterium sp. SH0S1]
MSKKLIELMSLTTTGPYVSPTTLESSKNVGDLMKNAPIFKDVYSLGKAEGMREGYCDASVVFEKKLKSQFQSFLERERDLTSDLIELERLMIEMEDYVEYLTSQTAVSKVQQLKLEESLQLDFKSNK